MDKFIPSRIMCSLVTHKYVIEGDYEDPISVPEDVKLLELTVPTWNGADPTGEQVWRELNSRGIYSYKYKLTSWWRPVPEQEFPF